MPRPYPERSRLKGVVLERVRAGATLKGACGRDGVPSEGTVLCWARTDAGFRGLLDEALRVGAWRRIWAFDEGKARALLEGLRAGGTLKTLLGRPGMPSERAYRYWRTTQPWLREQVGWLRQGQMSRLGAAERSRKVEAMPPWSQAAGDRVIGRLHKGAAAGLSLRQVLAADPELPGPGVVRRWRREQPGWDAEVRRRLAATRAVLRRARMACTPELTEAIWEKIVEGGSFRSIGAEPGMPCRATLARWVRTEPAFAARVREACVDREDWYRDHIDVAEAAMAPGMTVAELKAIRARSAPWRVQLGRLKNRPGARPSRG